MAPQKPKAVARKKKSTNPKKKKKMVIQKKLSASIATVFSKLVDPSAITLVQTLIVLRCTKWSQLGLSPKQSHLTETSLHMRNSNWFKTCRLLKSPTWFQTTILPPPLKDMKTCKSWESHQHQQMTLFPPALKGMIHMQVPPSIQVPKVSQTMPHMRMWRNMSLIRTFLFRMVKMTFPCRMINRINFI